MADQKTYEVKIIKRLGKKSQKPYEAVMITVGRWTKLVFTDSQFELDYLRTKLTTEDQTKE